MFLGFWLNNSASALDLNCTLINASPTRRVAAVRQASIRPHIPSIGAVGRDSWRRSRRALPSCCRSQSAPREAASATRRGRETSLTNPVRPWLCTRGRRAPRWSQGKPEQPSNRFWPNSIAERHERAGQCCVRQCPVAHALSAARTCDRAASKLPCSTSAKLSLICLCAAVLSACAWTASATRAPKTARTAATPIVAIRATDC